MIKLSALLGQDAVSLATAAKTGTVKGITLDGSRIVAVALSERTIPASAVRSFEGDVLTYDDDEHVAEPVFDNSRDVRGVRVLDTDGDALGVIKDLGISADGVIETVDLDNGDVIDGVRLRAVGSYAAIVWAIDGSTPAPAPPRVT